MKLTLVRHGRPDEDHTQRPHDPPLRADGLRQAEAVAALLAGEGVTRIVASPLKSARAQRIVHGCVKSDIMDLVERPHP